MPSRDVLDHLSGLYATSDDPWQHRTSPYEAEKFKRTLAAIGPDPFAEALEIYRALLKANPNNFDLNHLAGIALFQQGFADQALALLVVAADDVVVGHVVHPKRPVM